MPVSILPVVEVLEANGTEVLNFCEVFLEDFSCPGKEDLFVNATKTVSVFIEDHPYDPDGFRSTEGILIITNSVFQKGHQLDLLWIDPRRIHLVAFTVCFKPSSEMSERVR